VCVCVCVCVCMCIRVYVYVHMYVCTYVYMFVYMCMYAYPSTYTHTHTYIISTYHWNLQPWAYFMLADNKCKESIDSHVNFAHASAVYLQKFAQCPGLTDA